MNIDSVHGGFLPPLPSLASRKISLKSTVSVRTVLTVILPANNFRPRIIICESKNERNCMVLMLAKSKVYDIREQQLINYVNANGKTKQHTIDFVFQFENGRRLAVNVKPFEKTQTDEFKSVLQCVSDQLPPELADKLVLFTDHHYQEFEAENAERLFKLKGQILDEDREAVAQTIRGVSGYITVNRLLEMAQAPNCGFGAILEAIFNGQIKFKTPEVLTLTTLICRGELLS